MGIAEMSYNTDKAPCLIIKFCRPTCNNPNEKTTVNLLKKGKLNFDGGNSQMEIRELYLWLSSIYKKYASEIIINIGDITNTYNSDTSECDEDSIYDESPDECKKSRRKKIIKVKKRVNKKVDKMKRKKLIKKVDNDEKKQ